MKLKKKTKRFLILILLVLIVCGGFFIYKNFSTSSPTKVKNVDSIKEYGYNLKSTHPEEYKKMFAELKEILKADKVDEEAYAKKMSQMFIYDFFSLDYKLVKTDVGGVEFVHTGIKDNFLDNAQNTYYKYLESNIYKNRKQKLPRVTKVEISGIDNTEYSYSFNEDNKEVKENDPKAYQIDLKWSYTNSSFDDYQKKATLILVHYNKKLQIVECKEGTE